MDGDGRVRWRGRVLRPPRWRVMPGGASACSQILVLSAWDQARADLVAGTRGGRVVVTGALADRLRGRLASGALVAVTGRLRRRGWIDRDGVARHTTELVADGVRWLPPHAPPAPRPAAAQVTFALPAD